MYTKEIYIYGAGGHGRVVADIAYANGYDTVHFLDDSSDNKFHSELPKYDIIVAIGHNEIREKLCKKVRLAGFNLVSLIHPTAVVSENAKIGEGTVVMPRSVVNAGATVGEGCIVNTSAVVEHDCFVGEYAHISPQASLAGHVYIDKSAHVGIGSCIIQGVSVGAGSVIGAGSVVVRDIPANMVAFGNPCRTQRHLKETALRMVKG